MPTNNFVESSFWNFDALFQPQQHPARDSHDTFFVSQPAKTRYIEEKYCEAVRHRENDDDEDKRSHHATRQQIEQPTLHMC